MEQEMSKVCYTYSHVPRSGTIFLASLAACTTTIWLPTSWLRGLDFPCAGHSSIKSTNSLAWILSTSLFGIAGKHVPSYINEGWNCPPTPGSACVTTALFPVLSLVKDSRPSAVSPSVECPSLAVPLRSAPTAMPRSASLSSLATPFVLH